MQLGSALGHYISSYNQYINIPVLVNSTRLLYPIATQIQNGLASLLTPTSDLNYQISPRQTKSPTCVTVSAKLLQLEVAISFAFFFNASPLHGSSCLVPELTSFRRPASAALFPSCLLPTAIHSLLAAKPPLGQPALPPDRYPTT